MGRFLPDFGRVVGQTQLDLYHVYTVDEHSIRAIGVLSAIERGDHTDELPLASTLVHQLRMRDVLYLALLLHDVAKGRGGDHSEIGAEIGREVARRLEFTPGRGRNRGLAGPLAPALQHDGVQARPKRSAHRRRFRGPGALAGASAGCCWYSPPPTSPPWGRGA